MAPRRKQRVLQHIMEDGSFQVIKKLLPVEWVVREFNNPDYGIDLVVELFETVDKERHISEALGEYIFVQAKSVESVSTKLKKIYPVQNVTKGYWQEDKTQYIEIEVIKYTLDANTIVTIQQAGAGVSVLLFLVDLQMSDVYFVCLNDYIDKILLPQNPGHLDQDSYTIDIPAVNRLSDKSVGLQALKFYGKRAKLLSAFSLFHYQKNELAHLFDVIDFPVITYRHRLEAEINLDDGDKISQLEYFINQLDHLDVWKIDFWPPVKEVYDDLQKVKKLLGQAGGDISRSFSFIMVTWKRLSNLGNMYEELCREWFLPKFLSFLISYPARPNVVKVK